MKAAIFAKKGKLVIKEVPDPKILKPTDAIVKITYSCICGSDLWAFRGQSNRADGARIGHEFMGIVEKTGKGVKKVKVGDLVISPFSRSCGKCPECLNGIASSCRNGGYWGDAEHDGGQGEKIRVPLADAMLFRVTGNPKESQMPALLTLSDVLCTGYHAAVSAGVGKGKTVAVIGDGAVGLCAALSSKCLGAKEVYLLSTHQDRAKIGKKFGAKIINARGEKAFNQLRKLTSDAGADCVLECVGTAESWETAFKLVRKGGRIGWVGVPHGAPKIDINDMFNENIGVMGGKAPARSYMPALFHDVMNGKLKDAGLVFTKTIALDDIQEGYELMHDRKEIKVLIKL